MAFAGGVTQRLGASLRQLMARYRLTEAERMMVERINAHGSHASDGADGVVLIEAVEDHYYVAVFERVISHLRRRRSLVAEQFVPRSLRMACSRSPLQALKSFALFNPLTDRKWMRLYATFCTRIAYRSAAFEPANDIVDFFESWRIWRGLRSRDELVELSITGVKVGDLINDAYLRFKPAVTVDLTSWYLWIVIWQALRDLRRARRYFAAAKPRLFLSTYSTYVQHGIAVRVALQAGVPTFTFGNYQELCKELSANDWTHTRNPDEYRARFARLEHPQDRLQEAARALEKRLAGGIDPATAYMQRSAYASRAELPKGLAGSLVLFLHDFYDSPHCYRWMLFPDFWEWAVFTLDHACASGLRVFVKPHPNQVSGSRRAVRDLMRRYPKVGWLSSETSNVQLAEERIGCAVTVHGTVAHEMAYLGIPCIAAGHNPHIGFSICHTARDREEYRRLLSNYALLPRSLEAMRNESLQFYCMHNLSSPDELDLKNRLLEFHGLLVRKGGGLLREGVDYLTFVDALDALPAFHAACHRLGRHLADANEWRATPAEASRERAPVV